MNQKVTEAAQRLFAWQKLKEANFPTGCKHPYQGDSGIQEAADTKLVCTELLISGNYTANDEVYPTEFRFANGRIVRAVKTDDGQAILELVN